VMILVKPPSKTPIPPCFLIHKITPVSLWTIPS
jgi:hypothetical protein